MGGTSPEERPGVLPSAACKLAERQREKYRQQKPSRPSSQRLGAIPTRQSQSGTSQPLLRPSPCTGPGESLESLDPLGFALVPLQILRKFNSQFYYHLVTKKKKKMTKVPTKDSKYLILLNMTASSYEAKPPRLSSCGLPHRYKQAIFTRTSMQTCIPRGGKCGHK